MADATVTPAPPVADTVSPDLADVEPAQPLAESTGLAGEVASPEGATAAQSAAASVPSDESGSTEAKTVRRSCGAKADSHYVPSKGSDSNQCYDSKGKFQPSRTYTATHYTNHVACGEKNRLPNPSAFFKVHPYAAAGPDGGYVGFCSDKDAPFHGRGTARADADGSAEVVWDGDQDNPDEAQGWASATVSADGAEYRCGKSYAEGGRGTSDAPTSADNADQCSP